MVARVNVVRVDSSTLRAGNTERGKTWVHNCRKVHNLLVEGEDEGDDNGMRRSEHDLAKEFQGLGSKQIVTNWVTHAPMAYQCGGCSNKPLNLLLKRGDSVRSRHG